MRFSILIGAVALASGCFGQSGSEVIKQPPSMQPNPNPLPPKGGPAIPGIPPTPHCPCDGAAAQQQVRAEVLGVETIEPFTNVWRYELRALQVLSEPRGNPGELAVGDRFGGYWNGQLACEGTGEPFAVGAEVLAFHRRGLQDGALCCEYIACSDGCPAEGEGDDNAAPDPSDDAPVQSAHSSCVQACETQTAAACAEHAEEATLRGELLLMPWGETFVVGETEYGTATITAAELPALLLSRDACQAALEDRAGTLHSQVPAPSMNDDVPGTGNSPTPLPSTPPPPSASTPPAPSSTPDAGLPAGMTPAPPTPGVNPSSPASGPPPAHPEEVRVRCR